jgi:hypothetical protein
MVEPGHGRQKPGPPMYPRNQAPAKRSLAALSEVTQGRSRSALLRYPQVGRSSRAAHRIAHRSGSWRDSRFHRRDNASEAPFSMGGTSRVPDAVPGLDGAGGSSTGRINEGGPERESPPAPLIRRRAVNMRSPLHGRRTAAAQPPHGGGDARLERRGGGPFTHQDACAPRYHPLCIGAPRVRSAEHTLPARHPDPLPKTWRRSIRSTSRSRTS